MQKLPLANITGQTCEKIKQEEKGKRMGGTPNRKL
jgi:hypothetical protein